MPTQHPNSFVIIAPKGAEYSSMSDEDFEGYNASGSSIIELTLQEYAAWVITADTLAAKFKRVSIADPTFETGLTMRRLKLANGYDPTVLIQDFPGMAPGQFNASRPLTSRFRATDAQIGPVGSEGRNFRFFLQNIAFFDIKQFYHRDKFYLAFPSVSTSTRTVTLTPTSIILKGTGSSYDEYSYTLS